MAAGVWSVGERLLMSLLRTEQPSVSETVAPSCSHLQPLVDGLSCSELSRLKALELLGGDGLWEAELQEDKTKG